MSTGAAHASIGTAAPVPRPLPRPVATLLVLVFLAVLVRTAWISDDG